MSNTSIYHSALEDMFEELLLESSENSKSPPAQELECLASSRLCLDPMETPKRLVHIRQHNIFAQESQSQSFVIYRRTKQPAASPELEELRKERQRNECLRRRRERAERAKQPQRLTFRI